MIREVVDLAAAHGGRIEIEAHVYVSGRMAPRATAQAIL